jgi:hypothetical protein
LHYDFQRKISQDFLAYFIDKVRKSTKPKCSLNVEFRGKRGSGVTVAPMI